MITLKRIRRFLARRAAAAELAKKKAAYRRSRGAYTTRRVLFVCGCQRSGTTMVGYTIGNFMDVDFYHESDQRAFRKVLIRPKAVRDRLISRSTGGCVTFKPISDSHRIDQLISDHPGSKACWVFRRWQDVANSCAEKWGDHFVHVMKDVPFGRGDWSWRGEGLSDAIRSELQTLWKPDFSAHDASALFWYMRNRIYFEKGFHARPDIMPLRYETAVKNPAEEFELVCRLAGIDFHDDAVAGVRSDSVGKKPCPVMRPDLVAACDALYDKLCQAWIQWRQEHMQLATRIA